MNDKIKITKTQSGEVVEDNHGNVGNKDGVFCAETKTIIPQKQISPEELSLVSVPITLAAGTPEQITQLQDKEIALGDLKSPLQAICEQHTRDGGQGR